MKVKHLAVGIVILLMAASANLFGDSLTLTGTALVVASVDGTTITGGTLAFSDPNYLGGWNWGSGGTLDLTGSVDGVSGTLLSDDFQNATVTDISGTSFQVTFGAISGNLNSTLASALGLTSDSFTGGSLTLTLYDPSDPQLGSAFTSSVMGGTITTPASNGSGTPVWSIGSGGTVSAADSPTSMPEPRALSLLLIGLVAITIAGYTRAQSPHRA